MDLAHIAEILGALLAFAGGQRGLSYLRDRKSESQLSEREKRIQSLEIRIAVLEERVKSLAKGR